ncbi:MAG: DUF3417 domain-containing protein, partial [Actinomycetota bacterium]|nr:DUF3417 domain-containing protein [Actinomycetota bacterium]
GWAISSAENHDDLDHRDRVEADSLFEIIERQIIPLFYDRSGGRYPRPWVQRIKASLRTLGPRVQASRMVGDYVTTMYEPTAARTDALSASGHAKTKALAAWKARVVAAWPAVSVVIPEGTADAPVADLGECREVEAFVSLGDLDPGDIAVEALHGAVVGGDELATTSVVNLTLAGPGSAGAAGSPGGAAGVFRYSGSFTCDTAGRHGFTVRVVPAHPDLALASEMGCVVWA